MTKKIEKNQRMHDQLHLLAAILAQWRHSVASNKTLDLLHQAMHTVLYRRTAVAIKIASKVGPFLSLFHLLLPWWPLGQYGAGSCPMVAYSGFPGSPGHAPLGDAVCIAWAHHRGHPQQRRCICLSSLISSSIITIAK
jgi:hypothetical protein